MITAYFEDFTLLQSVRNRDGYGHAVPTYTPLKTFRAGLTATLGKTVTRAESTSVHAAPLLVHELSVRLKTGDVVRREKDQTCYFVEGASADMQTPDLAAQGFAQVSVKRLVNAP